MTVIVTLLAILAVSVLVIVHGLTVKDTPPASPRASPENGEIPPIEQLLLWEACGAGGRTAIAAHLILQAHHRTHPLRPKVTRGHPSGKSRLKAAHQERH